MEKLTSIFISLEFNGLWRLEVNREYSDGGHGSRLYMACKYPTIDQALEFEMEGE